jgi:hypothetical protein
MRGGQILSLYESEFFKFKGVLGYEIDGIYASDNGKFLTADGNLTTLAGLKADYEKNGVKIQSGVTLENYLGLKDQNLMTDFSTLDHNTKLGINALKLKVDASQKLDSKTFLTGSAQFVGTKIGSQIILTTGIIKGNTSLALRYQDTSKAIPIGNHLQNVNLLQNRDNRDGLSLIGAHNFSAKEGKVTGTISGYGGLSTSTVTPQFYGGATLKVNLNPPKKKAIKPK